MKNSSGCAHGVSPHVCSWNPSYSGSRSDAGAAVNSPCCLRFPATSLLWEQVSLLRDPDNATELFEPVQSSFKKGEEKLQLFFPLLLFLRSETVAPVVYIAGTACQSCWVILGPEIATRLSKPQRALQPALTKKKKKFRAHGDGCPVQTYEFPVNSPRCFA